MNGFAWIKVAAAAAMITVVAVIVTLVPWSAWSIVSGTSFLLLVIVVGFVFLLRLNSPSNKGGDAVALASLGPLSTILIVLIPWTIVSLITALGRYETAAWIMNIVTVGGFAVTYSVLRAASSVIDSAASSTTGPNLRKVWQGQLQKIALSATDSEVQQKLNAIIENLRYGASDIPGVAQSENELIDNVIQSIINATEAKQESAELLIALNRLATLVSQRDLSIKMARSMV